MTLLVRDEEDIIAANIAYHLSQGVDFIIATDNLSEDRTPDILHYYARKGVLRYILEEADDYHQTAWVTRMARLAHDEHGADWVLNTDADEFWWPANGNLRDVLTRVPDGVSSLEVQRHNFATVDVPVSFFSAMTWREVQSLNTLGDPLMPKVAHRGSSSVVVAHGNHWVEGLQGVQSTTTDLEILHYPVRSLQQIENKIAKGGAAYARNTVLDRIKGLTWRNLYDDLQRDHNLEQYYKNCWHDCDRIAERLAAGTLVPDRRLADFFITQPELLTEAIQWIQTPGAVFLDEGKPTDAIQHLPKRGLLPSGVAD